MEIMQRFTTIASASLRRAFRYRGLMVVVLWQAAPVHSARNESGALRLRFGYGTGQFEDSRFSCDGRFLGSDPVRFRTVGADVEAWPTTKVRLSGNAGHIRYDGGRYANGMYRGALIAREGSKIGIGGGVAYVPYREAANIWPSGYLRFGRREHAHLRFDLMPPEMTLGSAGLVRIGIGANPVGPRKVSGLAGLALCHFCDAGSNMSGFAALDIPLSRAVGLDMRALWGPGHDYQNYGFSVAGRVQTTFSQSVQPRPVTAPTRRPDFD